MDIQHTAGVVAAGLGATAILDLWLLLQRRLGIATLPMALIGRWSSEVFRGRFAHAAIRQVAPVRYEAALGWTVHYAVGVMFAAALPIVAGAQWFTAPTPGPALGIGIASAVLPAFVMQPAMGFGMAASRTPTPFRNCLRTLVNHTVLGLGFYVTAIGFASIVQ